MRVRTMKKSDSRRKLFVVFIILFTLIFISQIELSSISGQYAVIKSIKGDQGIRSPIICNQSYANYEICSIRSPAVLDPKVKTFYVAGPKNLLKKGPENVTVPQTKEVTLSSGLPNPPCMVRHKAPALAFSAGGCTGSFFHDFNDRFVPLFITVNSVYPYDRDNLVLVISNTCDWWLRKYADLLRSFSRHPIINLDNDTATHCFPSATVGLLSHGFMMVYPKLLPNSKTLLHFHAMLKKAYGQSHHPVSISLKSRPPRLVLARRSGGGRVIVNHAEVKRAAEEEGFDVIEFEPKSKTPLREVYKLISSSHAMVGVHGAALTHLLFLRPGAVLVQVVPVGVEWVSEACFGVPAKDMGLEYMEYKIGVEESSLVDKYERDNVVIKDPMSLQKKGWSKEIMDIYLVEQNVKLDTVRFGRYLKKAYLKAIVFMGKEG